jgi:hypothetical protein
LSNSRSTRCRRSSAPSPPPRRYRYLPRRCAWSRTKGNPHLRHRTRMRLSVVGYLATGETSRSRALSRAYN